MNEQIVHKNRIAIRPYLNDTKKLISKNINVFLTDLKGHILFEGVNSDYIDITHHPKGNYIAFLTDLQGGLIRKVKIIKE
jgi:hypothetical protein